MSDLNQNEQDLTNDESVTTPPTEEIPQPDTTDAEPIAPEKGDSTEAVADDTPDVDQESASAENESATPVQAKKKSSWLKEAVDYMEIFVFAICFVILLFSFAFRLCTVEGESMENTLYEKESLIVTDLFYTPKREDIIVFHQTGTLNEPVVKRVIATEGETVHLSYTMDTMIVTVTDQNGNQTVLEEPYMKYDSYPLYYAPTTITVPEGKLFVMGDNRNNSKDSRHPDIGLVDSRRVLGKVILRVSPLSRIGTVE